MLKVREGNPASWMDGGWMMDGDAVLSPKQPKEGRPELHAGNYSALSFQSDHSSYQKHSRSNAARMPDCQQTSGFSSGGVEETEPPIEGFPATNFPPALQECWECLGAQMGWLYGASFLPPSLLLPLQGAVPSWMLLKAGVETLHPPQSPS
ncbi:hypothetical protein FQA47_004188 [Oryzias melastigma]|uniref:Uncharacterized protein n=1 Tax=Oryzias melastigma TaxID=30732 RepID=A0A834FEV7_ORYME|nr:hypothetical protein FQA47_004188 [Oryzias melastigma]